MWVFFEAVKSYPIAKNMNEIIQDWEQFCEGRKSFDKSHFYTLFWEGITRSDLEGIFKYFPRSNELVERLSEYLFGKREKAIDKCSLEAVLVELAIKDIEEKKSILDSNCSLLSLLQELKVEFVDDFNNVAIRKTEPPYIVFFDSINDVFSDCWTIEDKKAFALYDALYGLTKDYEMVWYLFSPLFKINLDLSYYYRLTTLRGIYTITNNQILVSKKSDS